MRVADNLTNFLPKIDVPNINLVLLVFFSPFYYDKAIFYALKRNLYFASSRQVAREVHSSPC
jgi:hypothetical protein